MKPMTRFVIILGFSLFLLSGGMNVVFAGNIQQEEDLSNQDPIFAYFSGYTGLETETIKNYQHEGFVLGDIAQAFHITQDRETLDLEPVLTQVKEVGWGVVYKELLGESSEHKGLGWLFKEEEKPGNSQVEKEQPEQANNDQEKTNNGNNDNSDKVTGPPEQANNDKDKEKENNGKGNDKVKP